jgi:hypothetical protein
MCQGVLAKFSDGHRSSFISWTAVISGSTPPEMEEEGEFLPQHRLENVAVPLAIDLASP